MDLNHKEKLNFEKNNQWQSIEKARVKADDRRVSRGEGGPE